MVDNIFYSADEVAYSETRFPFLGLMLLLLFGTVTCIFLCFASLYLSKMRGRFRKKSPSHPSMWSISFEQLMEFERQASIHFGDSYPTKTMRDVTNQVIVPFCQSNGQSYIKSYALTLNPKGLPVDAFVTHCWDEPFANFVNSIQQAFLHVGEKPNLWICSFAIQQGDPELIHSMLNVPLDRAPFSMALKQASTFVVVRNSTTDIYSRIWCVCELMYARKYKLIPHNTSVVGSDCFRGSQTSCLDAHASSSDDKEKILRTLLEEHNPEEIDSFIRLFRAHHLT